MLLLSLLPGNGLYDTLFNIFLCLYFFLCPLIRDSSTHLVLVLFFVFVVAVASYATASHANLFPILFALELLSFVFLEEQPPGEFLEFMATTQSAKDFAGQ